MMAQAEQDLNEHGIASRERWLIPSSRETVETIPEEWGSIARGGLPTVTSSDNSNPLGLRPGRIIGLEGPTGLGLTRLGLSMLAEPSQHAPVVVVDVRGWICPTAAWETGVRSDRLAVVRCDDLTQWPSAIAALLEGVKAIYAEVPSGVPESAFRRLGAMARSRDASVVFRPLKGQLPAGVAYLRVRAEQVVWNGARDGHGRLGRRLMTLMISGKGAAGRSQQIELEDDGTRIREDIRENLREDLWKDLWKDNVRVVSRLGTTEARRAAG